MVYLGTTPSAATHGDDYARWQFRTFMSSDGLAHDIVRDVIQDAKGHFWFATMHGVTLYDGDSRYRTWSFSPGRREVMSIAEGKDGAIWIGTQRGGIARFSNNRWRWFGTQDGLPSTEITSVMVDKTGAVWTTLTRGGLARYAKDRWRIFGQTDGLSPGEIGRCGELPDGGIVCGTYGRPLLQIWRGKWWRQIRVAPNEQRPFYVHAVSALADGSLWLATKGAGVIFGQPIAKISASSPAESFRWTVFDRSRGLASDRVGAIYVGRGQGGSATVWAATPAGISFRTLAQPKWRTLTRNDGLGGNHVFGITQSRDGAMWIATLGGGVSRFASSRWAVTARSARVNILEDTEATMEIAGKIYRRSQAKHRVRDGAGKLYFILDDQVGQFDGLEWRWLTKLDATPYALLWHANALWAATSMGVARYDNDRWRKVFAPANESRANRIYSLVTGPKGRLWASGLLGVWHYDDAKTGWQAFDAPHWLPSGIYSRFAFSTSDGSLWFAVRGLGVRRYKDGLWTAYDSSRGLLSDQVRGVEVEKGGHITFDLGVEGLDGYSPDNHAPQTYIGSSAAAGLDGQQTAPLRAIQGEPILLNFGGQDRLKDTPTPALRFAYRIDGEDWSPYLRRTLVVLRDLTIGKHRVEVRALDWDLNLDPTPANVEVEILRPWWMQPWVWLAFSLALLAIGTAVRRTVRAIRREREAIRKEKSLLDQRRQFVRLASHELRKPLARMGHRAEMLNLPGALATPEKVAEYAAAIGADSDRLAGLVESLLTQAKVSEALELDLCAVDLSELLEEVLARTGEEVGSTWQAPSSDGGPFNLQADALYLSMAIRNLLDNGHKYGGGLTKVRIQLLRQDHTVQLMVSDQGEGIAAKDVDRLFEPFQRGPTSPNVAGFGLGLSFARDIARAHGGDLRYLVDGKGATFMLELPLERPKSEEN